MIIKSLFILSSTFLLFSQVRAETMEIHCADPNRSFRRADIYDWAAPDQPQNGMGYNYSTATLICPHNLKYRIDNHLSILCSGLWSQDYNQENKQSSDTPAILRIRYYEEGDYWYALFRTNLVYGETTISIPCTIKAE